jgi:hypothetical protein
VPTIRRLVSVIGPRRRGAGAGVAAVSIVGMV